MSQDSPKHPAWWYAQERIEEIDQSLKGYHQGPIAQGSRVMDNQFHHPAYLIAMNDKSARIVYEHAPTTVYTIIITGPERLREIPE
jgi:hypothetical protein